MCRVRNCIFPWHDGRVAAKQTLHVNVKFFILLNAVVCSLLIDIIKWVSSSFVHNTAMSMNKRTLARDTKITKEKRNTSTKSTSVGFFLYFYSIGFLELFLSSPIFPFVPLYFHRAHIGYPSRTNTDRSSLRCNPYTHKTSYEKRDISLLLMHMVGPLLDDEIGVVMVYT